MQDSEPESSPDRLRVLIACNPRAYRDVLGTALGILRPECEIRVLSGDLQVEIDRFRPQVVIHNCCTSGSLDANRLIYSLIPDDDAEDLASSQPGGTVSGHADFFGLLQVIDRAQPVRGQMPATDGGR